jgi:hypothetical protein
MRVVTKALSAVTLGRCPAGDRASRRRDRPRGASATTPRATVCPRSATVCPPSGRIAARRRWKLSSVVPPIRHRQSVRLFPHLQDEKRVIEASTVAPLIRHPPDGGSTPRIEANREVAATSPDGSFNFRTGAACGSTFVPTAFRLLRLLRARVVIRVFTELGKSSTALKTLTWRC